MASKAAGSSCQIHLVLTIIAGPGGFYCWCWRGRVCACLFGHIQVNQQLHYFKIAGGIEETSVQGYPILRNILELETFILLSILLLFFFFFVLLLSLLLLLLLILLLLLFLLSLYINLPRRHSLWHLTDGQMLVVIFPRDLGKMSTKCNMTKLLGRLR